MSRSNNTELITPVTRTFEWVGSKGCLKYFDRNKGEKGENVFVQLPFSFLVLDKLATIRGFSDHDQSGFWSNEVRNIKNDVLTVRTKKGVVAEGVYSTLAPILNQGACYCQSLYIAYYDEEKQLQIGKFEISGSAIGSWIEICKGKDIYKFAFKVESALPKKKGATNYFEPVYKTLPVSEETDKKAIEMDKVVQEYLAAYFKRNVSDQIPAPVQSVETVNDARKEAVNATHEYYQSSATNYNDMPPDIDPNDLTVPLDDEQMPF